MNGHLNLKNLSALGWGMCECLKANKYENLYNKKKEILEARPPPKDINIQGIFSNNELKLSEIEVYGFDYDYTLACYKKNLQTLIYNLGRDILVKRFKYPEAILKLPFLQNFAIRGLHYDIKEGLLLKLDNYLQIQTDSVYRGLTRVSEDEVLDIFASGKVPMNYAEKSTEIHSQKMAHLADLFAVPEIFLLSAVTELFKAHKLDFNTEILFHDVKQSIGMAHPIMHQIVMKDPAKYIKPNPKLRTFFERLTGASKKLFVITNSPFQVVDKGMNYLIGKDWLQFFDVIIVNARKPKFFVEDSRPFRTYDVKTRSFTWDRVTKFEKGKVYFEGSVKLFSQLTQWANRSILYFGDHPYSDLADAAISHGWRTAAIIYELKHELNVLNQASFKTNVNWLQLLTHLIEETQDDESYVSETYLKNWNIERDLLSRHTTQIFNKYFGSVFRTFLNPSYFSRRLFRYSHIYTSEITNLLNYSINHTFYPRRLIMPHEYMSFFI